MTVARFLIAWVVVSVVATPIIAKFLAVGARPTPQLPPTAPSPSRDLR